MSKLSPIAIIAVGISIAFVALSFAWLMIVEPNKAEAKNINNYADQLQQQAALLGKANDRKKQAEEMVAKKAAEWKTVAEVKSPPPSAIDLSVNPWQLVIEARAFRNKVQAAVNAQMKKGGVVVLSGPRVPMPSESPNTVLADYFNYPPFQFPVVIYDFGAVQVQGTYKQITDNIRAWSNMPNYLAVADGLQITGTTPHFTATYNLTLVGYIRGKDFFPPVPDGSGG